MTHYRAQEWPAGLFPEPDAKKRAGGDGKNRQIRGGSRSSPCGRALDETLFG